VKQQLQLNLDLVTNGHQPPDFKIQRPVAPSGATTAANSKPPSERETQKEREEQNRQKLLQKKQSKNSDYIEG